MPEIYISALNIQVLNPVALQLLSSAVVKASLESWNTLFEYNESFSPPRFYVNSPPPSLFNMNLAYGVVAENGKFIYEDALDHLAEDLIGAPDHTLFFNLEALILDIIQKSGTSGAVQTMRTALMRLVAGSDVAPHPNLLIDDEGRGYMVSTTGDNICREVFRQMPSGRKQNGKIVFEAGDRISFKYTFQYLNDGAKTRSYTIKLNLE